MELGVCATRSVDLCLGPGSIVRQWFGLAMSFFGSEKAQERGLVCRWAEMRALPSPKVTKSGVGWWSVAGLRCRFFDRGFAFARDDRGGVEGCLAEAGAEDGFDVHEVFFRVHADGVGFYGFDVDGDVVFEEA